MLGGPIQLLLVSAAGKTSNLRIQGILAWASSISRHLPRWPQVHFVKRRQDLVHSMFTGSTKCWTLCSTCLDRSRTKQELAALPYSLPIFYTRVAGELVDLLSDTDLAIGSWVWITAKTPKEAFGSNDCGVFTCCLAATYMIGIEAVGRLEPWKVSCGN